MVRADCPVCDGGTSKTACKARSMNADFLALWSINSMVAGCSVAAEVPPPLPVKQRAKSMVSERGSVSRLYSQGDGGSATPNDVSPRRSDYSYRDSPTDFSSSLDNVLAELNQSLSAAAGDDESQPADAAPAKPPRNVRSSSCDYDNMTSCEDVIDGKCVARQQPCFTVAAAPHVTRYSTSDGLSQNYRWNGAGTSECFVSSRARNGPVSEVTQTVVSNTETFDAPMSSSVPTTMMTSIVAPPLPMKLKHSKSRFCVIFTARAYARAVLGVVILSVRLSVCHTRGL